MARLWNAGGETQIALPTNWTEAIDGVRSTSGTTTASFDAANARLGLGVAFKFDTGATSTSTGYIHRSVGGSIAYGTDVFLRAYFKFTAAPTTTFILMRPGPSSNFAIRYTNSGTLQMVDGVTNIGSPTGVLNFNQWYRVEMRVRASASASSTQMEFLLDGTQIAVSTTVNDTSQPAASCVAGVQSTSGTANYVLYVDDIAVNDSNGTDQNSWCGDGKLVMLVPVSNNSVGNWKNGTGTSAVNDGNQWQGIDSTPPTVSSASPIATGQAISNAVSGASNAGIGDFNLTTYTNAGVGASDTINVLQMVIAHGEDASTGAKTGTYNIQSNPNQATPDTVKDGSGTNVFGPGAGGAVGAWQTNWAVCGGQMTYSPSVTKSSSPVGRINKTDTGTRGADLAFMGLWVDFVPAIVTDTPHTLIPLYCPILAQ